MEVSHDKAYFTSEQVEQLRANPYVKNISEKSITYSDEFKRHFVSESLDNKTAKQLFINSGFDPEVLGQTRIKAFSKKWWKRYSESGILSLKDTRRGASGRPRKTELTTAQQIAKLNAKISLLEEENTLLKKSDWTERRRERNKTSRDIFERIYLMKIKKVYTGTIVDACHLLGVSRSGYYNHINNLEQHKVRETFDEQWKQRMKF